MKAMRFGLMCAAVLAAWLDARGASVQVGTFATNPGREVVVPITLVTTGRVAYAAMELAYDAQVIACTAVEAGEFGGEFTASFAEAGRIFVKAFREVDANGFTGSLARMTFMVRDGTEGQFSDVTIVKIEAGDASGVRDVFAAEGGLATVNGMVRSMGTSAALSRLEQAQTVVAETHVKTLTLAAGDALQASADGLPIVVAEAVSAASSVAVVAPEDGWSDGEYELLRTKTAGLSFAVAGTTAAVKANANSDGTTTYTLACSATGEELATIDSGTNTLQLLTRNYVRQAVAALSGVKKILVKEEDGRIRLAKKLGLSAKVSSVSEAGEVDVEYGEPKMTIIGFDPKTGVVRVRVEPPEGQTISGEMVIGTVRVMGTKDLNEEMETLGEVKVDASMYQASGTEGEFSCTFSLGDKCFFKVVAEEP